MQFVKENCLDGYQEQENNVLNRRKPDVTQTRRPMPSQKHHWGHS